MNAAYSLTKRRRKASAQTSAQHMPVGADKMISMPWEDRGFTAASKNRNVKPSTNPTIPDSIRSLPVDRMRGLRQSSNALPAMPARKPKEPQDTAVIGVSQKAARRISGTVGDVVSGMRPSALRVAISIAEAAAARNAANAPAFKMKTVRGRFPVRAISIEMRTILLPVRHHRALLRSRRARNATRSNFHLAQEGTYEESEHARVVSII